MSLLRRLINKLRGNMDIDSLRKKGLVIGKNVFINFGCNIDASFCWLVEIGNNVTFAPNVHILAHDASTKRELGYTKLGGGGVKIGDYVFIGAGSIVLPGSRIGNRVVIGAGSVVIGNIPDNSVVVGSPAKIICSYDAYMSKQKERLENGIVITDSKLDFKERNVLKERIMSEKSGFIV